MGDGVLVGPGIVFIGVPVDISEGDGVAVASGDDCVGV